jgi:hypothetical protein
MNGVGAQRASLDRRIRKLLDDLKPVAASAAFVLVQWHGAGTSLLESGAGVVAKQQLPVHGNRRDAVAQQRVVEVS